MSAMELFLLNTFIEAPTSIRLRAGLQWLARCLFSRQRKKKEPIRIIPNRLTKFNKNSYKYATFTLDFSCLNWYNISTNKLYAQRRCRISRMILSSASVLSALLRMSLIQKALGYQPGAFSFVRCRWWYFTIKFSTMQENFAFERHFTQL